MPQLRLDTSSSGSGIHSFSYRATTIAWLQCIRVRVRVRVRLRLTVGVRVIIRVRVRVRVRFRA